MTPHRTALDNQALGRWCRTLLLSLFLLLVQQGALVHGVSHGTTHDDQEQSSKQSSTGKFCELCLAYATVGSASISDAAIPGLLTNLAFHLAPSVPAYVDVLELPSRRNRGPPAAL